MPVAEKLDLATYCRTVAERAKLDDAFALLSTITRKRLARRLLTVVDATNVQVDARRPILAVAREFHAIPVAIVLDVVVLAAWVQCPSLAVIPAADRVRLP